jgi:hypothetical protein
MGARTPDRRGDAPRSPSSADAPSPPEPAASADVDAFLADIAQARPRNGSGRLVVVIDATMSREPTWDAAMAIQSEMFVAAAARGGLDVELVFFRGFKECRASGWVKDAPSLASKMSAVSCRAGLTQIGRALAHVAKRAEAVGVDAFVYIGDAFEENPDIVCDVAGRLGLRGVRGFVFHEGGDPGAGRVFREIARLSGGSYQVFDVRSPDVLKALLGAAAAYAAGGRAALEDYGRTRGGAAAEVARALPAPEA